ncbi:hypothetical protein N0V84_010864 [Fusarium piperis]|uniref:Uncharacterized protein n=1 Tax=Fusarium piperis TaxID=1435070 RepID=A0A9W8TEJ1_9HYPO|nr:hypothetical protein N0V84_010864 [Fusarium piperis]
MMQSTIHQFSDLNLSSTESNKPSSPLPPNRILPRTLKRMPKCIGKHTIKADKSYIAALEDGRPRRDRKRNEGRRTKWWKTREKALMHHPGGFVEDSGLATKMASYYKALEETDEDEPEVDPLPSHATDTAEVQSQDGFALHAKCLDKERELRGTAAWKRFDEKLARDRVATTLSSQFASSLDLAGELPSYILYPVIEKA